MIVQVRALWHFQKKSEKLGRRNPDGIKITDRTFRRCEQLSRNCDGVKENQCQYRGDIPEAWVSVNCFAQVFAPGLRIARSRHSKRRWKSSLYVLSQIDLRSARSRANEVMDWSASVLACLSFVSMRWQPGRLRSS